MAGTVTGDRKGSGRRRLNRLPGRSSARRLPSLAEAVLSLELPSVPERAGLNVSSLLRHTLARRAVLGTSFPVQPSGPLIAQLRASGHQEMLALFQPLSLRSTARSKRRALNTSKVERADCRQCYLRENAVLSASSSALARGRHTARLVPDDSETNNAACEEKPSKATRCVLSSPARRAVPPLRV